MIAATLTSGIPRSRRLVAEGRFHFRFIQGPEAHAGGRARQAIRHEMRAGFQPYAAILGPGQPAIQTGRVVRLQPDGQAGLGQFEGERIARQFTQVGGQEIPAFLVHPPDAQEMAVQQAIAHEVAQRPLERRVAVRLHLLPHPRQPGGEVPRGHDETDAQFRRDQPAQAPQVDDLAAGVTGGEGFRAPPFVVMLAIGIPRMRKPGL